VALAWLPPPACCAFLVGGAFLSSPRAQFVGEAKVKGNIPEAAYVPCAGVANAQCCCCARVATGAGSARRDLPCALAQCARDGHITQRYVYRPLLKLCSHFQKDGGARGFFFIFLSPGFRGSRPPLNKPPLRTVNQHTHERARSATHRARAPSRPPASRLSYVRSKHNFSLETSAVPTLWPSQTRYVAASPL
jgi:hypothetical protein